MSLKTTKRQSLFNQAKAINENLGDAFKEPYTKDVSAMLGLIESEFDKLDAFEFEILLYRDQLDKLMAQVQVGS